MNFMGHGKTNLIKCNGRMGRLGCPALLCVIRAGSYVDM